MLDRFKVFANPKQPDMNGFIEKAIRRRRG
jgi:hypothetical protein